MYFRGVFFLEVFSQRVPEDRIDGHCRNEPRQNDGCSDCKPVALGEQKACNNKSCNTMVESVLQGVFHVAET